MAIFFTGILLFFLVASSPCRTAHIDAGFSLTMILVKTNAGRLSAAGIFHDRRERRINLRGVVAGDRLHLEIFLEAVLAPLAAVAGLLVAAERRGAVVRHALQVDVAGADLAGRRGARFPRVSPVT